MSSRWIAVMAASIVLTAPAVAHEEGIYESLHHIPIGRIFLSAAERDRLDRYREAGPPAVVVDTSAAPREPKQPDRAAGFIVGKSGAKRVWQNGDFVITNSSRDVRFPGHVEVERMPTPAAEDDAAEADGAGHDKE